MEKKLETLGPFKGIYRGYIGIYRDNGKENGNYYRDYRGLLGVIYVSKIGSPFQQEPTSPQILFPDDLDKVSI